MSIQPPNKQLTAQNRRFEEFLDELLLGGNVESDLTPELKAERRALADADEFQFCWIYFPQIFNADFNDMHVWIRKKMIGKYTLSGHRKSGKSAYIYVAKVIKHIVDSGGGVINIGARTLDISSEKTSKIYRLITRNKLIMYDYAPRIIQEEKGHYIINNCHLVATSVRTGLRSIEDDYFRRFKISVADDLYNRMTVGSEVENTNVLNYVESEVEGQMEDDGLSFVLGNAITSDAPIVKLRDKDPENHYSFPALGEDGETNWKGHPVYTTEYWKQRESNMRPEVWHGDYMDQPYDVGEVFDVGWLKFVNMNFIEILGSITVLDPSRGKSPNSSYKALVTLGRATDGKEYVQDIYMRRESWPLVFDYLNQIRNSTPRWITSLFENDFEQWDYAEKYYRDWLKDNLPIPIVLFKAKELDGPFGTQKNERMLSLVHPHQTGLMNYADTLEGSKDFEIYKTGYISYGSSRPKNQDGLDALTTAHLKLSQYMTLQTPGAAFKSLRTRTWQRRRL